MIRKALIVLLLGCSCSGGQTNNNLSKEDTLAVSPQNILADTFFNDTMFIQRKVATDYYYAIYIDTTRQSAAFYRLTDFSFSKSDTLTYQQGYQHLKSMHPKSFNKKNETNLPKNWLPVYRYKDQYYLYAPCDWGAARRRMINDSSLVDWSMEGPAPRSIQSIKRANKNKYVLDLTGHGENDKLTITIHTIDPTTKLSAFEFAYEPDNFLYELYVPAENAKHYPMIVNYCPTEKHTEFNFDKIDFEELLSNR
jgi:hypothetical protein